MKWNVWTNTIRNDIWINFMMKWHIWINKLEMTYMDKYRFESRRRSSSGPRRIEIRDQRSEINHHEKVGGGVVIN